METTGTANREAIEAWNGVLFDKFVRFRDVVTRGLGGHGTAALRRHPVAPGMRVLDIGCGFGDTTQALATQVGPGGHAVGVDCAARFIDLARREAEAAHLTNVRFLVGDVQLMAFDERFDLAFSRFGTMFFANPVAALKNVRRALRPGGQLCMVVWRRKDDNEWLHAAERVVEQLVARPPESDQPTCGPGPFSMASADVTSSLVQHAGFRDVALERCDLDICIGTTIPDAMALAMALGPAGELMRLAGAEAERRRPEVEAALTEMLQAYVRPDGVYASSSTWIVTATAP